MYLCVCKGITEADVRRAGYAGVVEPDHLITLFQLDAPSCCGRCERQIDRFVEVAAEGAGEIAREGADIETGPAKALPSVPQVMTHAARLLARSAVRALPATTGRHHRAHAG